jgi:trehalose-6-phosphate synthase
VALVTSLRDGMNLVSLEVRDRNRARVRVRVRV